MRHKHNYTVEGIKNKKNEDAHTEYSKNSLPVKNVGYAFQISSKVNIHAYPFKITHSSKLYPDGNHSSSHRH